MATQAKYITYEQAKDLFVTKEDLAKREASLTWKLAGLQNSYADNVKSPQ